MPTMIFNLYAQHEPGSGILADHPAVGRQHACVLSVNGTSNVKVTLRCNCPATVQAAQPSAAEQVVRCAVQIQIARADVHLIRCELVGAIALFLAFDEAAAQRR